MRSRFVGDFSSAATCILIVCRCSSASKRKISAASSPKSPVKGETGGAGCSAAGGDASAGDKDFATGGGDAGITDIRGGAKKEFSCTSFAGTSNPANPVACRA